MRSWVVPVMLVALGGCGGTPEARDASSETVVARPHKSRGSGAPKIIAEVGALDENAVQETFREARAEINACLERANRGMRYKVVGGDVEVLVRVKNDGTVRWSFPTHSTLGHADTERCILDALNKRTWPRPQGGEEGFARTSYGIDPPGRPAVEWTSADLGDMGGQLTSKLRGCQTQAGTSDLSVTLYVDPDGRVMSAGAAVGDEHGIEALGCAVQAASSLSFPSPGSYPAKVTLRAN